jgi:hypothetical protein
LLDDKQVDNGGLKSEVEPPKMSASEISSHSSESGSDNNGENQSDTGSHLKIVKAHSHAP